MAPVDVDLMVSAYTGTFAAMSKGKDKAITVALNCAGIPDPGILGWVIGKIIDKLGFDASKAALAIAIIVEYAKRTGSLKKGCTLSNKCSECHLKGHNKQNHPASLDAFLAGIAAYNGGDDINTVTEELLAMA